MAKTIWSVDRSHSEITFKVRHMMIANVTGVMTEYRIDAESRGDDFNQASVRFVGKTNSINTGNEQRDAHLASEEFFDVNKYPEITFESISFEKLEARNYKMSGNLGIHGITKKIDLLVVFGGISTDPYGNTKAGFSVTGSLNRKDFGLTWNVALETGGVLVGEDVKIACEIEMLRS